MNTHVTTFSTGYKKSDNILTLFMNVPKVTVDFDAHKFKRDIIMIDLETPKIIFKDGFDLS